jgi:hypothetical protein
MAPPVVRVAAVRVCDDHGQEHERNAQVAPGETGAPSAPGAANMTAMPTATARCPASIDVGTGLRLLTATANWRAWKSATAMQTAQAIAATTPVVPVNERRIHRGGGGGPWRPQHRRAEAEAITVAEAEVEAKAVAGVGGCGCGCSCAGGRVG